VINIRGESYRLKEKRQPRTASPRAEAPQAAPQNRSVSPQGSCKKPGAVYHRYEVKTEDCFRGRRKPECCPGNQRRGCSVMRLEESAMVTAFQQKMAAEEAQQQYRHRGRVVEFCHAWTISRTRPNKSASRSPVSLPNLQLAAVDSLASGCCSLNSANKKADAP
jgi:hypothetical protein